MSRIVGIPSRDTTMNVTPEQAAAWLKVVIPRNRGVKSTKVAKIMHDIETGQYMTTHQGLAFSKTHLIDGQHRLHAIIRTGKAVRTRIFANCDESWFAVIDTGSARSASDVLQMDGHKNAACLAATMRLNEGYRTKAKSAGGSRITNTDAIKMANDNPRMGKSVAFCVHYLKDLAGIVPPSSMAFVHYNVSKKYPGDADDFVHGIATGEGLERGDPRLTFRNRMIREGRSVAEKMTSWTRAGLLIRTWNAWSNDEKLAKIVATGKVAPLPRFKL